MDWALWAGSLPQGREFKYLWVLLRSEDIMEVEIRGDAGMVSDSCKELRRKTKLSVYQSIYNLP